MSRMTEFDDEHDYYGGAPTAVHSPPSPPFYAFLLRRLTGRPMARAARDWEMYYRGLYRSRDPDPRLFSRLLTAHGFWNVPNPFPAGRPEYFLHHPDGVVLADVDAVLDAWVASLTPSPKMTPLLQAEMNWAVLAQSLPELSHLVTPWAAERLIAARATEAVRRRAILAADCLARLFLSPVENWGWMSDTLHRDNRLLLMRQTAVLSPTEIVHRMSEVWVRAGWINEQDAFRFLTSPLKSPH